MPKTDSQSHLSPDSAGPQPTWAPPKSPLPPHKLAKLANALGVATPVPATHTFTLGSSSPASTPNSTISPAFPDFPRRSPTPSVASTQHTTTASTSKYLLHVIPPEHLPHDLDDPNITLPPPSASGYHGQFRRGVMVPVYSTLQSQLSAIAREYALPSTLGMVLYLILVNATGESEEPGPRISEDNWKHIWMRVLKTEKDELMTPKPKPLGLGFGVAGRSSPALFQDVVDSQSLRALVSPRRVQTPQIPPPPSSLARSPSTTSQSAYSSQSEIDAPDSASSVEPSSNLPLPGLDANSLIPILAKVEFDVDRQRATWYDPWLRNRKINHAKRAESRLGTRSASRMDSKSENGDGEEAVESKKKAPIDLTLVGKVQGNPIPNFLVTPVNAEPEAFEDEEDEGGLSYQRLDDEDSEDIDDEELEARLNGASEGGDPLEDVFGKDSDTWAEMHSEGGSKRSKDPNVVDLALDASAISNLPDGMEEKDEEGDDVDFAEIEEIMDHASRPRLSLSIPNSPTTSTPNKRKSSPATAGTIKKHIPPPLTLLPNPPGGDLAIPGTASPMPNSGASGESVHLAYLAAGATPMSESHPESGLEEELSSDELRQIELDRVRSPENEKRDGAVFDDLDLGLDPSILEGDDYDESDPNDRRRSQFIMSAQLDEIEKNLAQFSPRRLKSEDLKPEEIDLPHRRIPSLAGSMRSPSISSMLSPRSKTLEFPSPPKSGSPSAGASWPAVPYAALNGNGDGEEDRPPSPPKFAFNGVSTEPPKAFQTAKSNSGLASDETMARKRALDEENGLYPPLIPPNMGHLADHSDSPVIPLSPDPFGRYPSDGELAEEHRQSIIYQQELMPSMELPTRDSSLGVPTGFPEDSRPPSQTPSSRFSLDSVTSEEATKVQASLQAQTKSSSGVMGMKSIRKLWRKSGNKVSQQLEAAPPSSGRTSPNLAPTANGQPAGRPRNKSVSKPPPSPSAIETSFSTLPVPQANRSAHHPLQFNQESPYPIHPARNSAVPSPSPPSSPSVQQGRPSTDSQAGEKSIRKSILKSWKSSSNVKSRPTSSSATPRSSTEHPDASRKRKPNILDVAASTIRGSSSTTTTLVDIPPSPALPQGYSGQPHARNGSNQSQNTLVSNGRPSMSSNTSSPPRGKSPLTASSPPRNGNLGTGAPRTSVDSYESRPSFDTSQFEMVSPPKTKLTYPYHGLDQSMSSVE